MRATKQIRLSDPVIIRRQITDFIGKKINIVLADNRVLIGELKAVEPTGIRVMNMRLKSVLFPFHQLSEIYIDTLV